MKPNQQQLDFINSPDDRIILTAVPGSGKTQAIAQKIKHEIEVVRVNPSHITCMTFTNAGADSINDRLAGLGIVIGFCGTIDSYCLNLIKKYGNHLGYPHNGPEVKIIDEHEAKGRVLKKAQSVRIKDSDVPKIVKMLGTTDATSTLSIIAKSALVQMRADGVGTYETIKSDALRILRARNIAPCAEIMLSTKALFADEAQDLNGKDWEIIESIFCDRKFVCGDEDQTLYEWRGAEPQQFLAFDGVTMTLATNYRSAQKIVSASNRLIAYNRQRKPKQAVNARTETGVLSVLPPTPMKTLAELAKLRHSESGSVAVLFRYNRDVDEFFTHIGIDRPNGIHVGTIHSAKGLEFDSVILVDWLPKSLTEEERRLFYVGMTRAKDNLWIVRAPASIFTAEAGLYSH
jgi:DNA helicase-2/ATP-dependent DNA helicase PcrA